MELIALAAGAVAAFYFLTRDKAPATAAVTTPAPAPAKQLQVARRQRTFSGADAIVSGGYQFAPYNTGWGGIGLRQDAIGSATNPHPSADPSSNIAGAIAATGAALASTFSSPPIPAPAPVQRGGIAGTVGTGGLPLGGALRTGLSSGTGTTVVGTTKLQLLPLTKTLF